MTENNSNENSELCKETINSMYDTSLCLNKLRRKKIRITQADMASFRNMQRHIALSLDYLEQNAMWIA